MVNGTAMLASPLPTMLSSTASPAAAAPSGAAAGARGGSGFAALLTGVATPAPAGSEAEPARPGANAEADLSPAAAAESEAALPATPAEAATQTGNILPVVLPDGTVDPGETSPAAERDDPAQTAAGNEPAAVAVGVPTVLPGLPPTPANSAAGDTATSAQPKRRPTVQNPMAPTEPHTPSERSANAGRRSASAAIAVSVRSAEREGSAGSTAEAIGRPVSTQATEPTRFDAAPAPQPGATTAVASPVDHGARLSVSPTSPAPAPMPSPTDIDAAIDRLVAAREALVPAAAALAIDHADFGEVSIRFEQAADGRLSAELASADPVLREAVAAAIAERGSMGTDTDGGRPSGQSQPRGQAAGGDGTAGERGPSADTRNPQRGTPGREQPRPTANNPHPGVFA